MRFAYPMPCNRTEGDSARTEPIPFEESYTALVRRACERLYESGANLSVLNPAAMAMLRQSLLARLSAIGVFALDVESLGLKEPATGAQVMAAVSPHILAQGEAVGKYTLNPDVKK